MAEINFRQNNAENIGAGSGLFIQTDESGNLEFKTLIAGANIDIVDTDTNEYIISTGSGVGEANTANNVGSGVGIFQSKVGVELRFKSLVEGSGIVINESADEITINAVASGSGGGEANTGANVGGAEEVFVNKVGTELRFRTLLGGSGINVSTSGNLIRFDSNFFDDFNNLLIDFTNSSGIWVKNGENLGGAEEIFIQKDADNNLEFRTFLAGSGIQISTSGNIIRIENALQDDFDKLNTNFANSSGVFVKNAENVGGAAAVFSSKNANQNLELRTLLGGSGIEVEVSGNVIRFDNEILDDFNLLRTDFDNASGVWIKTASNIGIGGGEVFAQKVGDNLEFRRFLAGSGIKISTSGNTVRIDNTFEDDFIELREDFDNASGVWVKNAENLGAGSGFFIQKNSEANLEFKTLIPGTNITITDTGSNEYVISASVSGAASGEANIGANIGGAEEVFKDKIGSTLRFRTLLGGSGIEVTTSGDIIRLDSETLDDFNALQTNFNNASGNFAQFFENVQCSGVSGVGIFHQKLGNIVQLHSLVGGSGIQITLQNCGSGLGGSGIVIDNELVNDFNQLRTNFDNASGNFIETASNVGIGTGESFSQKVGQDLQFRRLLQGSGVQITTSGNTIRIDNALEDDFNTLETNFANSSGIFLKNLENLGGAAEIFIQKDAEQNAEIRTLLGGSGIEVWVSGNVIRFDSETLDDFNQLQTNFNNASGIWIKNGINISCSGTEGVGVLHDKLTTSGLLRFHSLIGTSGIQIQIDPCGSGIIISTSGIPLSTGESNTGDNVGIGSGEVFAQKNGATLEFRRLLQGSGINISTSGNTVRIDNTLEDDFNQLRTDFDNASGIPYQNVVYIGKHGDDSNTGLNPDNALLTIASGIALAESLSPSNTNKIRVECVDAGLYAETISPTAYIDVCAKSASLSGQLDINEGNTAAQFKHIIRGVPPLPAISKTGEGTAYVSAEIIETDSNNAVVNAGQNSVLHLNAGSVIVGISGISAVSVGISDNSTEKGYTHLRVDELLLRGNSAPDPLFGLKTFTDGKIIGKIGIIHKLPGASTNGGIDNNNIMFLNVGEISTDVAYDAASGSILSLECRKIAGEKIEAEGSTVHEQSDKRLISDKFEVFQQYIFPTEDATANGDIIRNNGAGSGFWDSGLTQLETNFQNASGMFYRQDQDLIPNQGLTFDVGSRGELFSEMNASSGFFRNGLHVGSGISTSGTTFLRVDNEAIINKAQINQLSHPFRTENSASTIDFELDQRNMFRTVLGENSTFNFINPQDGGKYTFIIEQDSAGSRTVTWPNNIRWRQGQEVTLTTSGFAVDIVTMLFEPVSGVFYADFGNNFF